MTGPRRALCGAHLGYGGSIAALSATWVALGRRDRWLAKITTESVAWTLSAVFVSVLVLRLIDDAPGTPRPQTHWFAMGLLALVWLAAGAAQFWRSNAGGRLGKLRFGLARPLRRVRAAVSPSAAARSCNPVVDRAVDNTCSARRWGTR